MDHRPVGPLTAENVRPPIAAKIVAPGTTAPAASVTIPASTPGPRARRPALPDIVAQSESAARDGAVEADLRVLRRGREQTGVPDIASETRSCLVPRYRSVV